MKSTVITSALPEWHLESQRVFLRADFNVPLVDDRIANDFRLQAALPTIDLILQKGGTIILATHIDRPAGYDTHLSTEHLIPWFKSHGYSIDFQKDLAAARQKSTTTRAQILLLENLRFYPGEQTPDPEFATLLASCADLYVNDAFGIMHRSDTSITLLPHLFSPQKRTIGLRVQKELQMLAPLAQDPRQPCVLLIGGAKLKDKIEFIDHFIGRAHALLICPALAMTFLKSQGKSTGISLIDNDLVSRCAQILQKARRSATKVVLPVDYVISNSPTHLSALRACDADTIPADGFVVTIGPKTEQLFQEQIHRANTVFYNGLMGFLSVPESLKPLKDIFGAMAQADTSIVAGGDSVAAAFALDCQTEMSFLSTGGGATLAYLCNQKLPGLEPFMRG